MASITAVAGEAFFALAASDRTKQVAHRLRQTYRFLFDRAEDKTIASPIADLDFLAGEGGAPIVGKLAGEFADRDLHADIVVSHLALSSEGKPSSLYLLAQFVHG